MPESVTRRSFLTAAASGGAALSCGGGPGGLPNIVLCMGDDHGWHETGYNGHSYVRTPVLDQMARTGLRLDRFYSAAPVCSPTRASVMTGRHPNRCGTFSANWSIRPEEIGVAEILREAGYACGHFGKWHLGPVKEGSPTNPGAFGFDEWLSHDNFFEMNPMLSRNGGPPQRCEGESSRVVVDAALEFMDRARQDGRPSFAVLWFGSPHEPYSGLDSDMASYASLPPGLQGRTARITSMQTGRPASVRVDRILQARFAEITAMDRAIGRLRDRLARTGSQENTLLWYCSDNGAPGAGRFGSPMRGDKGTVYEGGVRVPAVIEWPARLEGPLRSAMHAVTSDILPTLCAVTGQDAPARPLDGISLLPLIEGRMRRRPEPICFWSFGGDRAGSGEPYIDPHLQRGTTPLVKLMDGRLTRNFSNFHHPEIAEADFSGARAVLDSTYKLVVDAAGDARRELFDTLADPAESRDLAAELPGEVERLAGRLLDWQRSVLNSLAGRDYA